MRDDVPHMEDSFFTLSLDMLCIADFSGYFLKLNPAWEKTLGYSLAELQSRPMFDFVHPDDLERTRAQNLTVRTGGQALSFENRYCCKDGSFKWLLWNATPDFDRQVIYAVARDITERKRSEEERERLVRELQTALAEVKVLQRILPICMYCKKVRDDVNFWQNVETYIARHTETRFSHGICPTCYDDVMGGTGDAQSS
jgi:PAS domain S-box-containing protein